MSTPWECSWGGKRIDLWPRKQKIPDRATENSLNAKNVQKQISNPTIMKYCIAKSRSYPA